MGATSQFALEHLAADLGDVLGRAAVRVNQPLGRYTTLRIGGPADLLVVVENCEGLRQAVARAWGHGVPCRVLGGGSNVLISDAGVRGLVVLNRARTITFSPP